jgi:parallel beta-helix repeat protein
LISIEAEEIVALPDPSYICLGGSHAGTQNFGSINAAITDMDACTSGGGTVDGSLTIAAGNFDEDVVLNKLIAGFNAIVGAGSGTGAGATKVKSINLTNQLAMSLSNLNILNSLSVATTGGDLTLSNITLLNSTTSGKIEISSTDNSHDISLTDVTVDGKVDGTGTGVSGSGIYITGGDTVTLTDVQSLHNTVGVEITDSNRAIIKASDNGTSSFSGNTDYGVDVEGVYTEGLGSESLGIPSTNSLTIKDNSISENQALGLYGEDLYDGVILDNVNINDNGDAGVVLDTVGDVSITDTTVNDNNWDSDSNSNTIAGAQDITIDSSHFNGNGWDGDEPSAEGYGLIIGGGLRTPIAGLEFLGTDVSTGIVNIIDSTFSENTYIGLEFLGRHFYENNGAGLTFINPNIVTLDGVTANYNGHENIIIGGAGDVYITDTTVNHSGQFDEDEHSSRGLDIYKSGNVTLKGITADENKWDNIGVGNSGDVSISHVKTTNSYCDGMYIYGNNDVSLSHITSTGNGWGDGCTGTYLEENSGKVTISNSSFNHNSIAGVEIENQVGDITISNVNLNNNGVFDGDTNSDSTGLYTYGTNGTISISNTTANNNYWGIYLEDAASGPILLTNITALGNRYSGLEIQGSLLNFSLVDPIEGSLPDVNIVCSRFNNNGGGVYMEGVNNVTLNGVSATGNGKYDIEIEADGDVITLSGCSVSGEEIGPGGKIVDITGGEQIAVDCAYAFTQLVMNNGDFAKFAGFCDVNASFNHLEKTSLPGALPEGYAYAGGYTESVEGAEAGIIPASGFAKLSLVVPEEMKGKSLVVMFWDSGAGKWVEIPVSGHEATFSASNPAMKVLTGVTSSGDGKVNFSVNFTGTFVLVAK